MKKNPKNMTSKELLALPINDAKGHTDDSGFYIPPFDVAQQDDIDQYVVVRDDHGRRWSIEKCNGRWMRRWLRRPYDT